MALQAQFAEPPVRQIEVNLFDQPPLRANALKIANQQHPQHEFGINGGAARVALKVG